MDDTVKIFVGSDANPMAKAELVLEYSIRKHCKGPFEIIWMDSSRGGIWEGWDIGRPPGLPYSNRGWSTDFSCFRFAIPAASGFKGRAIYLDVDMIVLKDIHELFNFPMDRPVMITPMRYDVILFDCAAFENLPWWPRIAQMKTNQFKVKDYTDLLLAHDMVSSKLPIEWDCLDGKGFDPQKTALVHYTNMHTQPWKPYPNVFQYPPHPRQDMVDLFWNMYEEAKKNLI